MTPPPPPRVGKHTPRTGNFLTCRLRELGVPPLHLFLSHDLQHPCRDPSLRRCPVPSCCKTSYTNYVVLPLLGAKQRRAQVREPRIFTRFAVEGVHYFVLRLPKPVLHLAGLFTELSCASHFFFRLFWSQSYAMIIERKTSLHEKHRQ
eukprot:GEMP01064523.1.p1 GENE.GEMP01064523.1~~GEMP01064523.1.p1  ORF type:complete len:148 (+),score=6.42 GEMP01064523.1:673-1116(+)